MNLPITLIIGALVHALIGAGIFFAEGEPNKVQIFLATILKGLLITLLIGLSLKTSQGMLIGGLYGLLYGSAFGLVVFLAKGASFRTTPYLLSGSAVQGIATGILIAAFAFR
jgi:hypothetical protein